MAIVSDANILSSLAAADGLDILAKIFPRDDVFIPLKRPTITGADIFGCSGDTEVAIGECRV